MKITAHLSVVLGKTAEEEPREDDRHQRKGPDDVQDQPWWFVFGGIGTVERVTPIPKYRDWQVSMYPLFIWIEGSPQICCNPWTIQALVIQTSVAAPASSPKLRPNCKKPAAEAIAYAQVAIRVMINRGPMKGPPMEGNPISRKATVKLRGQLILRSFFTNQLTQARVVIRPKLKATF